MSGTVREIWLAPAAAAPMRRVRSVVALPGIGLEGDRYALGGGTWHAYPAQEKQVTLVDAAAVAEVAAAVGAPLSPADTRRNLVTVGVDLPALVGEWFTVGDVLMFGTKRCPPCAHLERLTGTRLVRPMLLRGGVNAAVFTRGPVVEGAAVDRVDDGVAASRGAPVGADRPVPRVVALG